MEVVANDMKAPIYVQKCLYLVYRYPGLQMLVNMVELLSLITLLMFVISDICTKHFGLLR